MDAGEYETLRRSVRDLKDRADIQDCLLRYTRGVDRLDWEMAASAYHPDAIDDRGAITGSPAEYLAWLRPIFETCTGTSHGVTNLSCEIDGDTAHAESYVAISVWNDERRTVALGGARYISRLERRDGAWRLVRQEGPMDFTISASTEPLPPGIYRGSRSREDRSFARPLQPAAEPRLPQERE